MNKKTFSILSLLTAIYIIGNFIWYQINKPIFVLQPESALYFFDVLNSKLFSQIHPPLFPLAIKLLFFIFGKNNFAAIYMSVNIVFAFVACPKGKMRVTMSEKHKAIKIFRND